MRSRSSWANRSSTLSADQARSCSARRFYIVLTNPAYCDFLPFRNLPLGDMTLLG